MSGILMAAAGGSGISDVISITDHTVSDVTGGSPASASYNILTNGNAEDHGGGLLDIWINNPTNAALYEVKADIVSGTISFGDGIGVYLSLGTSRVWGKTASPPNASTVILTITIRRISDSTIMDTATITITADATP